MEQQHMETCIICGRSEQQGIFICERLICDQCEKEMIATDVKEEKYHYFVDQMKKIWYKQSS